MKQVKDFIDINSGLFTIMYENYLDKYNILFDDMNCKVLDCDFYLMYSNKFVSPILEINDLKVVVDVILNRCYDEWENLKTMLTSDVNYLFPYYRKTTTQNNTETSNNGVNEANTYNKIYGFNSTVAQGDTEIISDSNIKNDGTALSTGESMVIGNNGNLSYSDIIKNEIDNRTRYFINIIFCDIKSLLTLAIY